MNIKVKLFRDDVTLPKLMTDGANGFDLFLPEPIVIPPSRVVPVGEAINNIRVAHKSKDDTPPKPNLQVNRQLDMLFTGSRLETKGLVDVGRLKVPLGFGIELPEGIDMSTRGRSGMAFGKPYTEFHFGGVDMFLGTIDMDYRGEIQALLFNFTPYPIPMKAGDRIGQIIFTPIVRPTLEVVSELSETERGERGLGHTDENNV